MTACILYEGWLHPSGYGYPWIPRLKRYVRAHRHVYEECFGPIPDGLEIHHRCGVKHCINPEHLEAMTPAAHRHFHDQLGSAARRARTHCKRGHEFTPENTYMAPGTRMRDCRICKAARSRRRSHHL